MSQVHAQSGPGKLRRNTGIDLLLAGRRLRDKAAIGHAKSLVGQCSG